MCAYIYDCICVFAQIIDDVMSSTLFVDANDTNATVDNGVYTCQVILKVAEADYLLATSNVVRLVLNSKVYFCS